MQPLNSKSKKSYFEDHLFLLLSDHRHQKIVYKTIWYRINFKLTKSKNIIQFNNLSNYWRHFN